MNTGARLGLFGLGMAAVFGVAFAGGRMLAPSETIPAPTHAAHSTEQAHVDETAPESENDVNGLAAFGRGHLLDEVDAPTEVGAEGALSFRILDPAGEPVVDYDVAHEKDLHLIVVRSDGTHFRHVHPELVDGTWTVPWRWDAAGTYRVFADFSTGGTPLTLSRTVDVAGDVEPAHRHDSALAQVDGFDVTLTGDLSGAGPLTVSVSRDGAPVTDLEPYLGAFGHLVALRAGDLAYLHAHPDGAEPQAGQTSGPEVSFHAAAPTAGTYFLYFDFSVDGVVHSAPFVISTGGGTDHTAHGDH